MSTCTPTPLDQHLCFDLYASSRAVIKAYGPFLSALGITYPQYLVMVVLWETGSASVGTLSERLNLDSGTLSPLLKRLEVTGLVRRSRSKEDERSVTVELTPKGSALQEQARAVPGQVFCKTSLSAEDCMRLQTSLRTLRSELAPGLPAS